MFITEEDYRVVIGENALKVVSQASGEIRDNAELEACEEIAGYLRPKYDTEAVFSAEGEERNRLVDALFGLLGTGGIDKALDIFHPRNIRTYIKTLGNDPETRQILSAEFQNLMEAAKRTRMQPGDAKTLPEGK